MDPLSKIAKAAARAALDPSVWPELLWQVGQFIGAEMITVETVDKAHKTTHIDFTDRPDIIGQTRDPYERYYGMRNPRLAASRKLPPFSIIDDDIVGDDKVLDKSEFYVDFLKPHGLKYFIGSPLCEDSEGLVILALHRAPDRGRVGDEERQRFRQILPWLRDAMALCLRIKQAPDAASAAWVLDCLADPIAIVREDTQVVFANLAMRELINAGDVVLLQDRKIVGANAGVSQALKAGMRSALATASCFGVASARTENRHAPLIFRVLVLPPDPMYRFQFGTDRLLCLLIDDPARPRWEKAHELMRTFGLTRQEANVGLHLLAGLGVPEIAARLGVSRNTVRTHVAALREKLGVNSVLAVATALRRMVGPLA